MQIWKRTVAVLMAAVMLLTMVPVMAETADASDDPIFDTVDLYAFASIYSYTLNVAFFDGCRDIPYISADAIADVLRLIAELGEDTGYGLTTRVTTLGDLVREGELSVDEEADTTHPVFEIRRENGSFVLLDAEEDVILISDRDKFCRSSFAVSGGDLVSIDGLRHLEDGTVSWDEKRGSATVDLYKRVDSSTFIREGDLTTVYLDEYAIEIREAGDKMYLPVATVSDLLMVVRMTYNGVAMFITGSKLENTVQNDDGKTLYDLYYEPGERERSPELASFTYRELCLDLDQNYGLKSEHGIETSFNDYFTATGLGKKLTSTDAKEFSEGLNQLMDGYFGDQHSSLSYTTPYADPSMTLSGDNTSISLSEYNQTLRRLKNAREAAGVSKDGEVVDGYYEVGDTAFITFDHFVGATVDYYDQSLWDHFNDVYMNDTISLVIWAHARIHRADSPIRKVVIDLSCNGGGNVDACVYIAAWVLGSCSLSLENMMNGARYTTTYWVDVNMDGVIGYDDELGVDDLDVYCLISGCSFSCGNLLPTMFKEDGRVTLVGQQSGGGSCIVRNSATADGSLISISDYYRMSIVKNGSFYSVDRGVEPDIYLRKCSSYYDREALAAYLDTVR